MSDVTGLAMKATATTVSLTDEAEITNDMLWAVVPCEDGALHIVNAEYEACLRQYKRGTRLQQSYSVTSDSDEIPVTFEFDGNATVIYTGNGSAAIDTGTSTIVTYNTKGVTSGWHFALVSIEKNEELHMNLTAIDDIVVDGAVAGGEAMYDLYGRKILTPLKNNIYIKGEKKIIAE